MIPYPSGQLHFGHFRIFSLGSSISKFKQLRQSTKIFFPLGFDSFGLPAEVASIKSGKKPLEQTENNISQILESLNNFGIEFSDYTDDACIEGDVVNHERVKLSQKFANPDRLLQTHTEAYYIHTQSLFLKLYHAGLISKKLGLVNYDPILKTTLASQEISNGISSRSGSRASSILALSWFVNITKYASKLYETPSTYPHSVSSQQKNWIGPVDGHIINVQVDFDNTNVTMKAFITPNPSFIICPVTHPLWKRIDPKLKSQFFRNKVNRLSGFNTGLIGIVGKVSFEIFVAPEFELASGELSFASSNDPAHQDFIQKHGITGP
jgi:leucyl-tRNA synthetase